ncbi:hypothetical protein NC653_009868 [Populus alba x Populus x berolinensis]|uniref:non-specific serine/threonine protein kinase n=1 Tax=Populus alba x Populus x berolinensis TaxID=444605 RepID=A0AAD6RAJ7_9ROSI|nr:hypothetical protein NC653_009868 [Populus alba x Populus x berolinensis]
MVRLTATYLWAHLSLLQLITFLGLHHPGNLLLDSNKSVMLATYLLAIWFKKIPERTIVWSANRNDLVLGGSTVQLTEDGELVLNDQSGSQIWIRPQSGGSGAAYAAMLDTGNFVVASQAGANLWQSFDDPTDTLLPTQNLNSGAQLIAPYLEKNYSDGRFKFILQADGNLILYTTHYPLNTSNFAYWSTQSSIGSGYQVIFNQSGHMYLVATNGTVLNPVFSDSVSMQDLYLRATLDYDGVLRQYVYPKTASSSRSRAMAWTTLSNSIPSNICLRIGGQVGSGACGFNSYCRLGDDQRPSCKCPPGYTFFDPNDERKGCKKDFISQDCDHPSQEIDSFEIEEMPNTNWPFNDYEMFASEGEDWCRQACLSDCYCDVAIYNTAGQCWMKRVPLSNGVIGPSVAGKALIKVRKGNSTAGSSAKKCDRSNLITTGSVLLGSSIFLIVLSLLGIYVFFSRWNRRQQKMIPQQRLMPDMNMQNFTYSELERATGGFKEELGRGAFGTVYKGVLANEDKPLIAVKKLDKMAGEGDKEFNTEVKVIGRTNHKNLVQLVGFCNEGQHRLLVYEYMSNGSLANFLFGDSRPNWYRRMQIAFDLPFSTYGQTYRNISLGSSLTAGSDNLSWTSPSGDFSFGFQQVYPKTASSSRSRAMAWTTLSNSIPSNICMRIGGPVGSGACGFNSYCRLGDDQRPSCKCPPGYTFFDPNDERKGCKKNFISQDCDHPSQEIDSFEIEEMPNTNWPFNDYEMFQPVGEDWCRQACLSDCYCDVTIYNTAGQCWMKRAPLSNGVTGPSVAGKALIKVRKGNSTAGSSAKKCDRSNLITTGSVLLGSSIFLIVLSLLGIYVFFSRWNRQRKNTIPQQRLMPDMNMQNFTYSELERATGGFKEELGRGAFGTVYKGVLAEEDKPLIAVKKLDKMAGEGDKEFNTEVKVIGRTNHKNLVQLVGFCNEGEHRLLVYEYMSNGSLANFLFGDSRPNWYRRMQIAFDIARGLLYLHEECSCQIIHCDIKPQNILLDKSFRARISDFGLAKLLKTDQTKTTTAIRGTKGYVALEWFKNLPVTTKVDTYSFGILLLELVCCRKNFEINALQEHQVVLADWACDCLKEGKLGLLVEEDEEATEDMKTVERFVMVAIWCIQDDPSLRPGMKKVVQMLEGAVQVSIPPDLSSFISTI